MLVQLWQSLLLSHIAALSGLPKVILLHWREYLVFDVTSMTFGERKSVAANAGHTTVVHYGNTFFIVPGWDYYHGSWRSKKRAIKCHIGLLFLCLDLYEYVPETDSWRNRTEVVIPRTGAGAVLVSDELMGCQ